MISFRLLLLFAVLCGLVPAEQQSVLLQAPLTTVIACQHIPPDTANITLEVDLIIPDNAPADLGIGAWRTDQHGAWFQYIQRDILSPGQHRLRFALGAQALLVSEPDRALWSSAKALRPGQAGLFFWSATDNRCSLTITNSKLIHTAVNEHRQYRLLELKLPQLQAAQIHAQCGQRWELSCLPDPFPQRPFHPDDFTFDLQVIDPRGQTQLIPGFFKEATSFSDAGDSEQAGIHDHGRFCVRFRPQFPGRHRLTLRALWQQDASRSLQISLPDLIADGPAWDDYIRVDPVDTRYFATGVRIGHRNWFWPLGLNMRSITDVRSNTNKHLQTRLTPERGTLAYEAYLKRLAASGANATEIWLSSWNLAMEWTSQWSPFYGLGDYNQFNAARLDRILDIAYELGIRVNLVIYNHGMANDNQRLRPEWHVNPYNKELGGPAATPLEFFTNADAQRRQHHYIRYLVARFADHPAILGWKQFSEINLTAAKRDPEALKKWFIAASRTWHELDIYDHPVCLHWSGDYKVPNRTLTALPEMDYICIDAYHSRSKRKPSAGKRLADLVFDGVNGSTNSLGIFNKPVWITEFGGSAWACPAQQLQAEQVSGKWTALVGGNAGAPMLWWWEWVDQNDHWQAYQAIKNFLQGEDIRNTTDAVSRTRRLKCESQGDVAVSWAQYRPGYLLGYVMNYQWGYDGSEPAQALISTITIGKVSPGTINVEWWDADVGRVIANKTLDHTGDGDLKIVTPPFTKHLAYKLKRTQADTP